MAEGQSLFWVTLEHFIDEVLEVFIIVLAFSWFVGAVKLPEFIILLDQGLVVGIGFLGIDKGWLGGSHDEENDRSSKEVNCFTVVTLLLFEFGGHETRRSDDGCQFGLVLAWIFETFDK